jgi:hypothetical protein
MKGAGILLGLLLVYAAVMVQGCVVAAVGVGAVGTVAYIRGDLEAVESASFDEVYVVTRAVLEELKLNVIKDSKDAISAVIVALDAEDKKITIKLSGTTQRTTEISIRVGLFGDESKSRLIYQKIHDSI